MSVKLGKVLKGVAVSVVITVLFMILVTVISYYYDVGIKLVDIFTVTGMAVGGVVGACRAAKSAGEKYGIYGLAVGICLLVIFLAGSYLINGKIVFNAHSLSVISICMVSGFFGGVLGR